ncbi:hypothetical protein IW261DRAFT_1417954 [Armillaria novae-zelandiae]|uniref:Uncharacterized protein n=1 Tax=Armillaria novae-zelandiae TaxID=153914 RepID=A0AA39PE16_9AGAR|nr:hypothetical protein IW261DRAFT_1417954 [Armillaria novae-zelandiae]
MFELENFSLPKLSGRTNEATTLDVLLKGGSSGPPHDIVVAYNEFVQNLQQQHWIQPPSVMFVPFATDCATLDNYNSLWTALGSENSKVPGDPFTVTLLIELWTELCSWIVEYLQTFVAEASKISDLRDSLATSDTFNLFYLLSENDRRLCPRVQSLDLISCLTDVPGGCSDQKTTGGVRASIRKALDDMAPARITVVLFRIIHLMERLDTSGSDIFTTIVFSPSVPYVPLHSTPITLFTLRFHGFVAYSLVY